MGRIARKIATSNVYHIIMRGVDKQDIFYDEKDRIFFMDLLFDIKKKFHIQVYAYCLMYNHFHWIIRVEKDFLSKSIQSLAVRYSQHFNKKYIRTGPLFEERFKSKCVENQKYLLDVCRYVHRNPESAGIAPTEKYKWSSYNEYVNKEKIVDKNVLLHYFNNDISQFVNFTINYKRDFIKDTQEELEYEFINKLTDEKLVSLIIKILKVDNINDISKLEITKKKEYIEKLSSIPGTNLTQISRVTRISRGLIEKCIKVKKKKSKKGPVPE